MSTPPVESDRPASPAELHDSQIEMETLRGMLQGVVYITAFPGLLLLTLISSAHDYPNGIADFQFGIQACFVALVCGAGMHNWMSMTIRHHAKINSKEAPGWLYLSICVTGYLISLLCILHSVLDGIGSLRALEKV